MASYVFGSIFTCVDVVFKQERLLLHPSKAASRRISANTSKQAPSDNFGRQVEDFDGKLLVARCQFMLMLVDAILDGKDDCFRSDRDTCSKFAITSWIRMQD